MGGIQTGKYICFAMANTFVWFLANNIFEAGGGASSEYHTGGICCI